MPLSEKDEDWSLAEVVCARTARVCHFCGDEIRPGAQRANWGRRTGGGAAVGKGFPGSVFAHYACAPGLGSPVYRSKAWLSPMVGVSSRIGGRTENEDRWRVSASPSGSVVRLAVADGMGGHAEGGEAAEAAVSALDVRAPLVEVVHEAHQRACRASRGGTTLTIAEVRRTASVRGSGEGREVVFAQVGDSTGSMYTFHPLPFRFLPLLETRPQGYQHLLLQCVGSANRGGVPDPTVTRARAHPGSLCFLYSDGVNPAMAPYELLPRVRAWAAAPGERSLFVLAGALTARAGELGSTDNATLLVFQVP